VTLKRAREVVILALIIFTGGLVCAGQKGIGVHISGFSPDDDQTEQTFDVDSGPIPDVFFRYQTGHHSVVAGLGFQNWSRNQPSVSATAELDFFPMFGSYRYAPWHGKPVSPFFGGGLGILVYDATVESPSTLESETAALWALEPVLGVEFLANRKVRLEIAAKYSWQIVSADDLNLDLAFGEPLDVDMTGLYTTAGLVFMWGE